MRRVGMVGNGSDKFTEEGKRRADTLIYEILSQPGVAAMVSGHSPVGGIDIWSEEIAEILEIPLDLKIPEVNAWNPEGGYGYKLRNLDIARDSTEVHVILADVYPAEYAGRRFDFCYHCGRDAEPHVKSGGCWTGKQALKMGKDVEWHIVTN